MESPRDIRGRVTAPNQQVTRETVQRHTNEVRGVGGAVSTRGGRKVEARGLSAVTALGTSANNGQWTARSMKNPPANRAVAVTPSRTGRSKCAVRIATPRELAALRAASPRYAA